MLQAPPVPIREQIGKNCSSEKIMSQHPSLRTASASAAKRNVMKRFERVELLKKRGQWKEGDRVMGLRKTKPD